MILRLETVELSRKYDGLLALDRVNLRASSEKITAIVGVNGAGKTSLLRILAGLDRMDYGKILIDSNEASPDSLRTRSTMVFQKSLILSGSVYDNVAYGLRVNHTPSQHLNSEVQSALSIVNLADFDKRKARKLSSGEQQRVSIARALAIERDILLIDEPTANLDPTNTLIIERAIRESARSRIIILSTHNLAQARRLSNWMIHLHKGRVVEENETSEFFANPRDERTKLFTHGELQV